MVTRIKKASGVKLVLKVGDGMSPEQFFAKCSINAARGITFSSPTNSFPDIDCDDPEGLAWLATEKQSVSAKITGAGTLNTPDAADFFAWVSSPDSKDCQVIVDVPALDGGIICEGAFHLTEFSMTGDRGAKIQTTISLESDGEVTVDDNT